MSRQEQSRRVVVLGASGFLGSAMSAHLGKAGHEVTAFCRRRLPSGSALARLSNVRSVVADLRDEEALAGAFNDVDVVYHFASATHPTLYYSDPAAEYREALQPLLSVMEVAARSGVKRIVFPSSGGTIYADSEEPRTELSPTDPKTPYAVFKIAAEQLLHQAASQGRFLVDVFRVGNPYGPGQRAKPGQGVLAHWIEAIKNNRPVRVFGDGSAERDYVYIDDACALMAVSCDSREESGTFNLGTGEAVALRQLLELLQSLLPNPLQIENAPGRPGDILSVALAPDRLLALRPNFRFTPLAGGVRRTLLDAGLELKP